MKKLRTIILVCILIIPFSLRAQNIGGVTAKVDGEKIRINYHISGTFRQLFDVSLFVSKDAGNTYEGPMKEVSGDVGKGIAKGNHLLTWEFMKEMPFTDAELIFDVRATVITEKIKTSWFAAYAGNLTTPLGLRAGTLGGTGWYIMGQTNLKPSLKDSYTYENGTITDYNRFAWYEFTSKSEISSFVLCGGITQQVARGLFLYAGAGYGKEDVLYEINEYSYEGDAPLGTDYARDTEVSTLGITIEAGIMVRTGKVIFSGGASSIGFNTPNWQAGLGFCF